MGELEDIERDAKVGVRQRGKRMGQLTRPSENTGPDEASSKRGLRRALQGRGDSLADIIRADLAKYEQE